MNNVQRFNWRQRFQLLKVYVSQWWRSLKGLTVKKCTLFPTNYSLLVNITNECENENDSIDDDTDTYEEEERINRLRVFCNINGLTNTFGRVFSNFKENCVSEGVNVDDKFFYPFGVLCDLFGSRITQFPLEFLVEYELTGVPYMVKYRFPQHSKMPFPPFLERDATDAPQDIYPTVESAIIYLCVENSGDRFQYCDVSDTIKKMAGPSEDFYQSFINNSNLEWKVSDVYEYIQLPVGIQAQCELEIVDDIGEVSVFKSASEVIALQY